MSQLTQMKQQYEQMTASPALRARVTRTLRLTPWRMATQRLGIGLAACLTLAVVSLNVSPAFAGAVADLPGLSGVVEVLTFGRFTYEGDRQSANVQMPQLSGFVDPATEVSVNADIQGYVDSLIAKFKQSIAESPQAFQSLDANYKILAETDAYLSLDVYATRAAGSAEDLHRYYVLSKADGNQITLASLFREGADYQAVLNDYLRDEMTRRMAEEEGVIFWIDDPEMGGFTGIRPDQPFYLDAEGHLVIGFAEAEIAPAMMGTPTFVIPDEVIAGIKAH